MSKNNKNNPKKISKNRFESILVNDGGKQLVKYIASVVRIICRMELGNIV